MCYLQDLLRMRPMKLLPQKVGEMLQIMEGDSLLKTEGFSHCGITSASIVDSPWNGHVEPYLCQKHLFQCWTGYALKLWKKIPQNHFKKWELKELNLIHWNISAACHIGGFIVLIIIIIFNNLKGLDKKTLARWKALALFFTKVWKLNLLWIFIMPVQYFCL